MKKCLFVVCVFFPLCIFSATSQKIELIFTSNLEGRFSVKGEIARDPFLILAQQIRNESTSENILYYDLGNSLYPGPISIYSFGSIMMDYFKYTKCSGSLVSMRDLSLGSDNLLLLSQRGSKIFLSSNVVKDEKSIFKPYDIKTVNGVKIAFLPVSSKSVVFNLAEKKVRGVALQETKLAIKNAIEEIKREDVKYIIMLSGLDYRTTVDVMDTFPEISFVVNGGDSVGQVLNGKLGRIDFYDGRSSLYLPKANGYYKVTLIAQTKLTLVNNVFVEINENKKISNDDELLSRLRIWKNHYEKETGEFLAIGKQKKNIDAVSIGNLLRDRYFAEVSILRNPIEPISVDDKSTALDVLSSINDLHVILNYSLTGKDLKKVIGQLQDVVITGYENKCIQRNEIVDTRHYRVVSTQIIFEEIQRLFSKKIKYKNRWKSLSDEIADDLNNKKVLLNDNYLYLENRFRVTSDLAFSIFWENNGVQKDDNVSTPTGKPSEKYKKIGTEDKLNINIFNANHAFTLSGYLYYIKQDDTYLQNLFRGSFQYVYNTHPIFRPYNRFQLQTQLVKVDNLQPADIRETTGVTINLPNFTSNVGFGFEREIKDPSGSNTYGLEFTLKYEKKFPINVTYTFSLDTFTAYAPNETDKENRGYSRLYMDNVLSSTIVSNVSVSLKYRWFNYYSIGYKEKYRNTQAIISFDYKTDFKVW